MAIGRASSLITAVRQMEFHSQQNIVMHKHLVWILLFTLLQAHAQVYRWVDEDGTTVYSQTPPLYGQSTTIKTPAPPAADAAAAQRQIKEQTQQVDDYLEDRELAREKKAQEKQAKQTRQKSCDIAQSNLQALSGSGRRLIREPDGSYVRLPEEQRQARMQKAREQVKKYCQ
jgi:hypothetical protein